ncbi:MAG: hypothetical protein MUF07_10305 [Steroidobacteraceae bacterium]|jgi:hypothetical protein|nr:hypothetical protein [Steroidobacteraceae bacterium]
MNGRLRQLELRQRALVLRSDLQRHAIAAEGAALGERVAGVEGRVAVARRLLSWPALGIAGTVLLAIGGPRRALRVASRLLVFATLARRAWGLVGGFAARARADGRGERPPASPG